MAEQQLHVFISHSRRDSDFVDRLAADLEARQVADCWVDRAHLIGGDEWQRKIEAAIRDCDVFLVALSPNAIERSTWVPREIGYALDRKKRIVPLMYRNVKLPLNLIETQYIPFEDSYEQGLDQLARDLSRLPHVTPPPPRVVRPQAPTSPALSDPVPPVPDLPPGDPRLDQLYRAGVEALARKDYEGATLAWQQVLQSDPNYLGGRLAQRLNEVTTNQLIPARIDHLRQLARAAQRAREWRKASGAWSALVAAYPDQTEARRELRVCLRERGFAAYRAGDWPEAIGTMQTLRELGPGDSLALTVLDKVLVAARTNQQYATLYDSAEQYSNEKAQDTASAQLKELYEFAPHYGDPRGVAHRVGLAAPPDYPQIAQQQEDAAQREEAVIRADTEETRRRTASQALRDKRAAAFRSRLQTRLWLIRSGGSVGLVGGVAVGAVGGVLLYAGVATSIASTQSWWAGLIPSAASGLLIGLVIFGLGYGLASAWTGDLGGGVMFIVFMGAVLGAILDLVVSLFLLLGWSNYTVALGALSSNPNLTPPLIWVQWIVGVVVGVLVFGYVVHGFAHAVSSWFKSATMGCAGCLGAYIGSGLAAILGGLAGWGATYIPFLIWPIVTAQPTIALLPGAAGGAGLCLILSIFVAIARSKIGAKATLRTVFGMSGASMGAVAGGVLGSVIWVSAASGYVYWNNAIIGIGVGGVSVGIAGLLLGLLTGALRNAGA